ncbi:MAG: protein kinase domain-containing protein [Ardenticatenaceae bacterium]
MNQFGRYEVINLLGGGGMADVYLAKDPLLGREVAIKVIRATFAKQQGEKEKEFRERFYREAQVMAQLTHPAIVPIYDFGEQDKKPFIVMGLMRGGSLGERLEKKLQQEGPFSLPEVVELIERLAPAIDLAHQRNMVHRDLKPQNILFDEFGNPVIADFGIVKLVDATVPTNRNSIGTWVYMSPEQGRAKPDMDHRTDIYALGAMTFELLTGKWPYESDNALGFAYLHNFEAIPNICDVNPSLPVECQPIIERALAKQPADRYNSVGELAQALKTLIPPPQPSAQAVDAVDLWMRGIEFYQQKAYQQAIAQFTKALRQDPAYPTSLDRCVQAYFSRGQAYYQLAEYALAIADYDNALRVQPNYTAVSYWRGRANSEINQIDQAIRDFDNALHLNPNYTAAYFQRGQAQHAAGRLDLAIRDYDAALRTNPNHTKAKTARDKAQKEQEAIWREEARQRKEAKKQQEAADKALLNNPSQLNSLPRAEKVALYVKLFRNEALQAVVPLKRRAAIGIELAQLGDPRPEVMTIKGMQFCWVPAGWFWMGSNDGKDDRYKPLHQVNIPYGYWIGRYPVTNAQFQAFVKARGYSNPAYWPEAQAEGYWQNGKIRGRDRPRDYGTPRNLPNHPVVGITWYEALAFTRWLSQQWPGTRLLSEAEWEKAARGGREILVAPVIRPASNLVVPSDIAMMPNPSAQRHHPWGDDFDAALTNSFESGIGHTNAVGAFLMAKSPCGAEEMSGNVWEWTQSQWQNYDYHPDDGREKLNVYALRVIRGGAFCYKILQSSLFFRDWFNPDDRDDNTGFRVLMPLSPLTSGPSDL